MATVPTCPVCDSPLPIDAPRGLCVECLMRAAEAPASNMPSNDSSEAMDGSPATQFGEYVLIHQIGRGGMGVVYEARQTSLNRIVALKMILGGDLASVTSIRRFRFEAEAAAKLDHPNIVAIYEFGEREGLPFFSMQRIEGTSLDRQMAALGLASMVGTSGKRTARKTETRQAQVRIAELIANLARALHYAHERGIIHCDVKPSNVLIDADGQPHLTDFGIARFLDQDRPMTKSGIMGTPRYMSPEQAQGRRSEVSGATDIYGLGVILYELLVGQPPFRASTPNEMLRLVLEQDPSAPHHVNPYVERDLSTICLKCLEKDARHRYGSAAELADDLERWMRQEPIRARRSSSAERIVRWCRRKPAIATLAASVVVLLLAVTISSVLFAWNLSSKEKLREAGQVVLAADLDKELEEMWAEQKIAFVKITSEKRSVLMGEQPRLFRNYTGSPLRLKFAVYTFERPSAMARKFAPLLMELEDAVAAQLRRSVRIDCIVYRSYVKGHAGLLSGEADFMRVGPASYTQMKEQQPGISLLAAQDNVIRCEIFTQSTNTIKSVAELKGLDFAFGDRESTFGTHLAKVALLRSGLRVNDLGDHSRHFRSHDDVDKAVASGQFAAGSANIVAINERVKVLHTFTNILSHPLHMPFISRAGLDPKFVHALRNALLKQRSPSVLTNIVPDLQGFREVEDQDYDELREQMKLAAEFGDLEPD